MPVRLLQLSDLHLGAHGSYLGQGAESRRRDFQLALEKAVTLATGITPEVHAVVICGDLFDTHRPPAALVRFANEQFQRLQEAGLDVLLVPGFHDALAYPDCTYHTDEFPGIHILNTNRLEDPLALTLNGIRCRFYAFPWQDGQPGETLPAFSRAADGDLHIALLHGPVTDAPGLVPWIPRAHLETSGMDYVALGYEHDYRVLQDAAPAMAYCGTLEATDLSEATPRGFCLVDIGPGVVRLSRIPHETRPVKNESIDLTNSTARESEDLIPLLEAYADPLCIARFRLQGTAEFILDLNLLRDALAPKFFYLEIEDETRFSHSALVRIIQAEPTIRGLFAHHLIEQMTQSEGTERDTLEFALKSGLQRFLEEELL